MRKMMLILLISLLSTGAAHAIDPNERLANPALEARARQISSELRCLVCQNQSIDDSNADLARDLRHIVRERLTAGDSDAQIMNYLIERYGEFVLMRPRWSPYTWALWATPVLFLLAGAMGILVLFRRQPQTNAANALSPEEELRLKSLLDAPD